MARGLRWIDGEFVRNSRQHLNTQGVVLSRRPGAARGTAVVRAGHPALDAALASDAHRDYSARTVAAMREAGRDLAIDSAAVVDAPATTLGRIAERVSYTLGREGAGTTIHIAVTRSVVTPSGKRVALRVWRELAQQSWN